MSNAGATPLRCIAMALQCGRPTRATLVLQQIRYRIVEQSHTTPVMAPLPGYFSETGAIGIFKKSAGGMMMAGSQVVDRFLDSMEQTSSTLLEAARDQNERQFRLSEAMLLEVQRVQHENIEIGRRFVQNPLDVGGIYRLFVDTMSKRQGRALEIGREVIGTLSESATEARETARKVISMQRVATEAATEIASRAVNTVAETVRESGSRAASAVEQTVERVADETARTAGETTRSAAQDARATAEMKSGTAIPARSRRARNAAGNGTRARRTRKARKPRPPSAPASETRNGA